MSLPHNAILTHHNSNNATPLQILKASYQYYHQMLLSKRNLTLHFLFFLYRNKIKPKLTMEGLVQKHLCRDADACAKGWAPMDGSVAEIWAAYNSKSIHSSKKKQLQGLSTNWGHFLGNSLSLIPSTPFIRALNELKWERTWFSYSQ